MSDTIRSDALTSFGATVLPVEKFIQFVEKGQFTGEAVFSTPETLQKLSPIAPVFQ